MSARDSARIRIGMAFLIASGVISVVGLWMRGPVVNQLIDPDGWAALNATAGFANSWWILLPNLVFQMFAWVALWAFMRDTPQERLAFWGSALSIAGNGFFLPHTGVIAFSSPAVARLYLDGDTAAIAAINAGLFGPVAFPFLLASAVLLMVGAILHGIMIWKSPRLPTWAAIPYVLHAAGLTFAAQFSYMLEYTGAIMLLLSGTAVGVAVWRQVGRAEGAAVPAA